MLSSRFLSISVHWVKGLCSRLHNYHFIDEPKSWSDAGVYCREKFSNLATISNTDDMKRLIAAVGSGYEGNVWIGLRDKRWDWKWLLSDKSFYGNESNFKKWNTSQPDNTQRYGKLCAAVQQGTWYDYECEQEFAFVCYDNNMTGNTILSTYKTLLKL
uniref:C-type lectin domain-containing protein n=1 Tax=Labrus bergylta TaxID=56723 RepID=A0A3Q3GDS5_9LABR